MFSLVYKILKITEHFWKGNQKAVNSDSLLGGYRGRGLTFSSYAVIDILKYYHTGCAYTMFKPLECPDCHVAYPNTSPGTHIPPQDSAGKGLIPGMGMGEGPPPCSIPITLDYTDCSIVLSYRLLTILSVIPTSIWRERPLFFKNKRICTKHWWKKETTKCSSI